jgi:hypothetical protein
VDCSFKDDVTVILLLSVSFTATPIPYNGNINLLMMVILKVMMYYNKKDIDKDGYYNGTDKE